MHTSKTLCFRAYQLSSAIGIALGGVCTVGNATCLDGLTVTSCADSGVGSLRAVVNCANTGQTVDLSTLSCTNSKITLTSGAIVVSQSDLTIQGNVNSPLTITIDQQTGQPDRVIKHTGTGQLSLNYLNLANGIVTSAPYEGGCLYSAGDLELSTITISGCRVHATGSAFAEGGGLFATGGLGLLDSNVVGNSLDTQSTFAAGGGVASLGNTVIFKSSVSHNQVSSVSSKIAAGGGVFTGGGGYVSIRYSVLSNNSALGGGGLYSAVGTQTTTITDSTIAGNTAGGIGGALILTPLTLSNSTIAFNVATVEGNGGGLYVGGGSSNGATLQSSILADNTAAGFPSDLAGSAQFQGSKNLIYRSEQGITDPSGTISNTCPKLTRLADNGGTTQTTALRSTSPAIDHGSNPLNLVYDQRIPYPRTYPTSGATDIGAYEYQGGADDAIFHSGFESGCDE